MLEPEATNTHVRGSRLEKVVLVQFIFYRLVNCFSKFYPKLITKPKAAKNSKHRTSSTHTKSQPTTYHIERI